MSLVGRHIGRYRILEQLGQGGMSVVYKGFDTSLDREVAVKVLHAHLAGKEESRRRLAREAKAVAKLHHPNILEIYDFAAAETEEQAYIVTEYIRGETLRQYAEASGFEPPEIAAMVIHEIASALAQAHESGIIHRDLKPENVMVREDGVLKLMDFGIAKIIDRDDKMTMTGALVGSPAHMAPEIIEGEEAGAEADVFSLGTMLFYFATGRLPFTAPNTTATLKRILDGLYDDPRQLVPTVSDDLAEIIATCLSRQPTSRYANAVKLRDALHDYLSGLGLGRTTEELQAFFANPSGYRKALVPRLATALIARSEALIAERRPAKALSALNQILAHDPSNARALELLSQMNAARKKQRANVLWKRAALIALGVAVVGGGAVPAVGAIQAWLDERNATDETGPGPLAITGPSGATGGTGAVGPGGTAGTSTSSGNKGATGPNGTVGVNGTAGANGTAGVKSTTGTNGTADNNGTSPNNGTAGTNGVTGPTGALAAKGPTGALPDHTPPDIIHAVHRPELVAKVDPKLTAIPVTFRFRPYGYLEIDGGPRSNELPVHQVALTPGQHSVRYGCQYCVPGTETITVSKDGPKEHYISLEALPARLSFEVKPSQALIRVQGVQRTAADSVMHPFEVRSPKGGTDLRHRVRYEIFLAGYRPITETLVVRPGETMVIPKSLQPE